MTAPDRLATVFVVVAMLASASCSATRTAHSPSPAAATSRARLEAAFQRALRRPRSKTEIDGEVRQILQMPLTTEAAVHIALLNNRTMRARILALRLSPERAGSAAARAELDRAQRRLGMAALDLQFQVRLAFHSVQAAQDRFELALWSVLALSASSRTIQSAALAGTLSLLEIESEVAELEAAGLQLAEAEADLVTERERMNILLGVSAAGAQWSLAADAPDVEEPAVGVERAEAQAIKLSHELAELRARSSSSEHRGRAAAPEAEALRELQTATEIQIRASVRAALARATALARSARGCRDFLVPARMRVLRQAERQYDWGQIDLAQLRQAHRALVEASRLCVDRLHEYRAARATLDQLLAGRIPRLSALRVCPMHPVLGSGTP